MRKLLTDTIHPAQTHGLRLMAPNVAADGGLRSTGRPRGEGKTANQREAHDGGACDEDRTVTPALGHANAEPALPGTAASPTSDNALGVNAAAPNPASP